MPDSPSKISYWIRTLPFLVLVILLGCTKGERKGNLAPDTKISVKSINLSGENRLNSTVRLSWFGTDPDGYIEGYELSFDNQNWTYTTSNDSLFTFSIPEGQDTVDIDLYVRAIDNEKLRDPEPAYLSIPLKNTPPVVKLNIDRGPGDTVLIVSTFYWEATDIDGNQTITSVEVKINDGSWTSINLSENLISFAIDPSITSGAVNADLYYSTDDNPAITGIDGFIAGDTNKLFIRATDFAGGVSDLDTSVTFFLKNKTPGTELLWVSGQTSSITSKYKTVLSGAGISYDLLHYGKNIDGSELPDYWDPTFKLISRLYPKMLVNSGQETFTNAINGQIKTILEFMAPVMLDFTSKGGKSLITTSFKKEQSLDDLAGPFPIDSLITPSGQARIVPDSGLVPILQGSFPDLKPLNVQSGIVPISASSDADDFYRARLTKLQGWDGSDVVATVRRPNNVWSQVLFGVELHYYNQDPNALIQIFQEILINEF